MLPTSFKGENFHTTRNIPESSLRLKLCCVNDLGTCKFFPGTVGHHGLFLFSDDVTMVICPGIGNHSEKHYIRTFVDYSQKQGYRCAVLNHLGALPNIELTSPRMFTYGKACVSQGFGCSVCDFAMPFEQTG